MSIRKIRAFLEDSRQRGGIIGSRAQEALHELEAIQRAAKDLTRLHIADGVDDVAHRSHVIAAMTTPESQWGHPDVKAWSDAAVLMERIAKETT